METKAQNKVQNTRTRQTGFIIETYTADDGRPMYKIDNRRESQTTYWEQSETVPLSA